jgi:hypothetical protein
MTRVWLAVGSALVVIGLLLGLPPPKRPAPAATQSPPAGPTLASVWPDAKPFPIPATFPDGSAYTPGLIVDPTTSIGTVARPDGQHIDLAEVPATGAPRILQTQLVTDGGSFDGITATPGSLYWMHTLSDGTGQAHTTLWTAPRSGGPARQLSGDVGTPGFYGSGNDVQATGDRLYWTATRPDQPDRTELRSIPLAGGTVAVKPLDGAWAMSTWPWLVTAPRAAGRQTRLMNVATGQLIEVHAPANKLLTCTPAWCRMIPDNALGPTQTALIRPDGSDLRIIGDADTAAVGGDVAVLGRFELLMTVLNQNSTSQVVVSKLAVYDIARRQTVLVCPASTDAAARGNYLWWSTGNNETLAWQGVDLRTLG